MSTPAARRHALKDVAKTPDLIAHYGLTREEVLGEVARQLAAQVSATGDLGDLVTISLAEAQRYLGTTRDDIRRNAKVINHGSRNQRITVRSLEALRDARTETPAHL